MIFKRVPQKTNVFLYMLVMPRPCRGHTYDLIISFAAGYQRRLTTKKRKVIKGLYFITEKKPLHALPSRQAVALAKPETLYVESEALYGSRFPSSRSGIVQKVCSACIQVVAILSNHRSRNVLRFTRPVVKRFSQE